ncbi:MAG: hydantoinase/oxoprolinase family protein [Actinomycetota bacterium]|nr:hydantoinase/oxoprolinase family protein [Actinomycetota bacterium]
MGATPDALVEPWRIGVDIGGTFTDLVVEDRTGRHVAVKVPSRRDDPGAGVLDAVAATAGRLGIDEPTLLGGCALLVHGTTIATNTILEGTGARVGLLTTEGFRDSLAIRRGRREDQWDHRTPWPPVLVPRSRRLGVRERTAADGTEVVPLDHGDVDDAAKVLAAEGVEAIAVAFMNSYADPAHEHEALELLRAHAITPWLVASADVAPLLGEYERTSTAVIDATLAPRVIPYLQALDERLRALGLRRPMLAVLSNGGATSVSRLAARAAQLVLSGPAAATVALEQTAGRDGTDLVSMEIGGTSCDVAIVEGGRVATTDELTVAGYHLVVPSVEIHTVGAGGGAIAAVDGAGLLTVGPRGAGAEPGPACYGRGGELATVTDAHLVLGRLRPGPYAGGSVHLDAGLAAAAIERHVARPLGIDVEHAAQGIIRLLEQHVRHAVETVSVDRGRDPAHLTLVAAGGAGAMHGRAVAAALGCRRVLVPGDAGVLCALGMVAADARCDGVRPVLVDLDAPGPDGAAASVALAAETFARLAEDAVADLGGEGFTADDVRVDRVVDLRYPGQLWSLGVDVAPTGALDVAAVRAAFEALHQRRFGHIQPGGTIEITAFRVSAHASFDRAPATAADGPGDPTLVETRRCWIDADTGWVDVPVWDGPTLAPGLTLVGPAVVEDATTTIVVGAGDTLRVHPSGDRVIELGAAGAASGHTSDDAGSTTGRNGTERPGRTERGA